MLGHEVTKKFGGAGLPDDTIDITFTGSAGQSFGAFLPRGVTLRLEGDANDYVGKGLSGGRVIVRPDRGADHLAEYSTIAGNTIAYGATGGELFLRGRTGERFCVRNSGATGRLRGRGRPRLRVHDRRPRGRPRRDGPQLRGRHVRRHRVRHRPGPRQRQRRQRGRRSRPSTTPTSSGCTTWCAATRRRPARPSPRSSSPTGPSSADRFSKIIPSHVQGSARRQGRRRASRSLRVRDHREDDGGGDQWLTPRAF